MSIDHLYVDTIMFMYVDVKRSSRRGTIMFKYVDGNMIILVRRTIMFMYVDVNSSSLRRTIMFMHVDVNRSSLPRTIMSMYVDLSIDHLAVELLLFLYVDGQSTIFTLDDNIPEG